MWKFSSGSFFSDAKFMWQPTLLSHDPNPPMVLEEPQSPARWDAYNKSRQITLTNGELTSTSTSTLSQYVRSSREIIGKRYAEFKINAVQIPGANGIYFGLQSRFFNDAPLKNVGPSLGEEGASGPVPTIYYDYGGVPRNWIANDVISIAVDQTSKRIWFRINGGNWNDSPTADPATGIGSIPYNSTQFPGAIYFAIGNEAGVNVVTGNFGASAFAYAAPSGFIGLDAFGAVGAVAATGVAGSIGAFDYQPTGGVAATGVGGTVTPNPGGVIQGVGAVGAAGSVSNVKSAIPGAASTGVAGQVIPNVSGIITGSMAAGVAGGAANKIVTVGFSGAAGIGAVGLIPNVGGSITGVGAIGSAGSIFTGSGASGITGAVGNGVAGIITAFISGGGGNKKKADPSDRIPHRRKPRTGFEPIKKIAPPAPKPPEKPKIELPPHRRRAPSIVPRIEPVDLAGMDGIDLIPLDLQGQIHTAEDVTDIMNFMAMLDQDEQDIADIADALALLD